MAGYQRLRGVAIMRSALLIVSRQAMRRDLLQLLAVKPRHLATKLGALDDAKEKGQLSLPLFSTRQIDQDTPVRARVQGATLPATQVTDELVTVGTRVTVQPPASVFPTMVTVPPV